MNFVQVLPSLFIGSHPKTVEDLETLRRELAVTAVLNLQTDEDMLSAALLWEALEAHYKNSSLHLVRVPVKEDQEEMRGKLLQCVRALDDLISREHVVYMHCTAGVARAPTVAIGYLRWCLGWELPRAVEHVKKLREGCSPHLEALQHSMRHHVGTPKSHRKKP
jgi:protein-tyrosine phosphatase